MGKIDVEGNVVILVKVFLCKFEKKVAHILTKLIDLYLCRLPTYAKFMKSSKAGISRGRISLYLLLISNFT